MLRTQLLELLAAYQKSLGSELAAETRVVRRISDFVKQNPLCFDRSLAAGHVTGSAWVINPADESALLTHHAKLNRWMQLGGHADGDANILRVALREAIEESGIEAIHPVHEEIFDVDVHEIPARRAEPAHIHYDIRFLLRAENENFKVSSESKALAWVPLEKISEYSDEESILRMTRKWKALNSFGRKRTLPRPV